MSERSKEKDLVLSECTKTFLQFPSRSRSRFRVTARGKTFSEQIGTGIELGVEMKE